MISVVFEGLYRVPLKTFKYKSKYKLLRMEFEPCSAFYRFLLRYSRSKYKMRGVVRCFFCGTSWLLEVDTSVINVTLETEEE